MKPQNVCAVLALPLLIAMLAVPGISAAHAQVGPIQGNWVITQAATQSTGSAPKIVACGTFTLDVIASNSLGTRGTYAGSISFDTTYANPSASQPAMPSGAVQGAWMIQNLGVLFVNFQASGAVPAFGSLTSPSPVPHPSINPTSVGCAPLSNGFMGLLHLPGQGTEGATLYSATPIDPSIFTS